MGSSAEERKGGETTEAAGEAGQRGETDPGKIETERKRPPYSLTLREKIQPYKLQLPHTQDVSFTVWQISEAVQKMLDEAENQLENGGPWMNPEAPVKETSKNYGTERDVANCPFFLKTGACRFGDRCSRKHNYPTTSPTLMVRGMFVTFGMEESRRDDYDIDACLEHSEEDLHHSFLEFYHDVLPEFRSIGKVVQFKVSCNYEPHLKGNVYVQFDTEEHCTEAFIKFNGRWYAGRQLHCEICPVTRWKNAICGLFDRQKCSKGKHCNFLHVFRNPGNEFWEADRDLHLSPNRSVRGSRRDGWHSERYGDRSWRQRRYSRSPARSERRSRSRERRSSYRAESRSSTNLRYSERRRRNGDRSRSRSRNQDRDDRSRSEERDEDSETQRNERLNSRGRSKESKTKQSSERSLKSDKSATRGHHKHSKKNKKKSKKKHKRKSLSPDEKTSAGDSEEEIIENQSTQSPKEESVSREEPAEKKEVLS
ncbi:U2 small nuclear ribonucleoprotein auxiliary factor 35 kDa subunit-related protein 2 isoform X2 [Gouania willdenowi]|uniref:U2 small nuclear ribonucleoprotein auxiliary factor 35 kDa subunit-related protein 2 isoform X2 n=1 Tax=Gouania willdenowi TaxID=441366 RepID=UPI001056B041|nr:U2 small nuclear ribonucleoprotein auxiliary factor 35 kDa subunit-related protein 2 isoform X2 [Gouania willdenowi]